MTKIEKKRKELEKLRKRTLIDHVLILQHQVDTLRAENQRLKGTNPPAPTPRRLPAPTLALHLPDLNDAPDITPPASPAPLSPSSLDRLSFPRASPSPPFASVLLRSTPPEIE